MHVTSVPVLMSLRFVPVNFVVTHVPPPPLPQEMGVEASQARVRHYLESRTIGGRDVIDPTGTLREIHGSQVRGLDG